MLFFVLLSSLFSASLDAVEKFNFIVFDTLHPMDLAGRPVLITGASSGIGAAIAQSLGVRGMKVALLARRRDRLNKVADQVERAGGEAMVAPADVRDEDELCGAFRQVGDRWGELYALVNNAGVGRSATFAGGSTEDWRAMLEVNVLALTIATREALRLFPPAGGHIVNVASLSGHRVPPKGGFYAATKFAVRALTEAMRLELHASGNPTRVSQVSPGFVATEFVQGLSAEDQARTRERLRSMQPLSAGDVAASVLHVLTAPEHVGIHDILLRSREQGT